MKNVKQLLGLVLLLACNEQGALHESNSNDSNNVAQETGLDKNNLKDSCGFVRSVHSLPLYKADLAFFECVFSDNHLENNLELEDKNAVYYVPRLSTYNVNKSGRINEITLHHVNIKNCWELLYKLDSLEDIRFISVEMSQLPDLGKFKRLKEIHLNNPNWGGLDTISMCNCPDKFEKLTLNQKKFKYLEFSESCKNQIKSLYISECDLEKIPDSVYELPNLTELGLAYNNITKIDLSRFKKLTFITLENNPIQNVDKLREQYKNIEIRADYTSK